MEHCRESQKTRLPVLALPVPNSWFLGDLGSSSLKWRANSLSPTLPAKAKTLDFNKTYIFLFCVPAVSLRKACKRSVVLPRQILSPCVPEQSQQRRGTEVNQRKVREASTAQPASHHPSSDMSSVPSSHRQWMKPPTGPLEPRTPQLDRLAHLPQPTYQDGALAGIYQGYHQRIRAWIKFSRLQETDQHSKKKHMSLH